MNNNNLENAGSSVGERSGKRITPMSAPSLTAIATNSVCPSAPALSPLPALRRSASRQRSGSSRPAWISTSVVPQRVDVPR
ncbi:MAG: hypothetical protein PBU97_18320 [Stenotrophomonas maltophilia]